MDYKEFVQINGKYNSDRDILAVQSVHGDEYYTMAKHCDDIINRLALGSDDVIWCPFDSDKSNFPIRLREHGFTNVYNTSTDFFTTDPPNGCKGIISNPPFSKKKEILKRCKELDIPFALMLPLLYLNDGVPLDYGNQFIFWRKRVHFIQPDGSKTNPRTTCFVLSNGLLLNDLSIVKEDES